MRQQHVMNQSEGAAVRVQLDAMINALQPLDQAAVEGGDTTVSRLIARLYDARLEASAIEKRAPLPKLKGVVLART